MQSQLKKGIRVLVPELADYEVRRELLRIDSKKAIAKLDGLKSVVGYAPLTTEVILQAATFWAQARNMGRPTAKEAALDGDMILAAQAFVLTTKGHHVVVATTNVKHLNLFADARLWRDIT